GGGFRGDGGAKPPLRMYDQEMGLVPGLRPRRVNVPSAWLGGCSVVPWKAAPATGLPSGSRIRPRTTMPLGNRRSFPLSVSPALSSMGSETIASSVSESPTKSRGTQPGKDVELTNLPLPGGTALRKLPADRVRVLAG